MPWPGDLLATLYPNIKGSHFYCSLLDRVWQSPVKHILVITLPVLSEYSRFRIVTLNNTLFDIRSEMNCNIRTFQSVRILI